MKIQVNHFFPSDDYRRLSNTHENHRGVTLAGGSGILLYPVTGGQCVIG
jgi:hypothetical protein